MTLLDRRLLFVTGKGGVGKTTVAAGLAVVAARVGRRVLVCEVDAKGDLAAAFESGPFGFRPREVETGVHAMSMETEASLREYLSLHLRIPLITRIGPLASTFDFVASAAPGVKEILTVGKLAYEVREKNYDLVIVDGPASGHIVGQLAAAEAIRELVQVGLIRSQTQWMIDILHDPVVTGVVVVTLAEEMPVTEAIELVGRLDSEAPVDVAQIVVNRVLPELFGRAEEELFDWLRMTRTRNRLDALVGGGTEPVLDAAAFAIDRRRRRTEHIERLRSELGDRAPLLFVPELFSRGAGRRTTSIIADALAAELM